MKLASLSPMRLRTVAKSRRRPGAKPATRFRRPTLHLERLEDRSLLSGPGDIEWLRQAGSVLPGTGFARAVDADGNVYVGGNVSGILPGEQSSGSNDAFLRKY